MTPLHLPPPARSASLERLDSPAEYLEALGPSLAEVRLVNRWLGGTAVSLGFLRNRPELRRGAHATLLDVATGTADIPLAQLRWAGRHGIGLEITATDLSEEILSHARRHVTHEPRIRLEAADATSLPYPDASFDYVTCNLALHHFPPVVAVRVISEMYRVASRAILVNDLVRSRPAYWSARLLFGLATRNPLTSHDGPLSVLRAYTVEEVRALGEAAGLMDFRVRTRPVFRLELVGERRGQVSS